MRLQYIAFQQAYEQSSQRATRERLEALGGTWSGQNTSQLATERTLLSVFREDELNTTGKKIKACTKLQNILRETKTYAAIAEESGMGFVVPIVPKPTGQRTNPGTKDG